MYDGRVSSHHDEPVVNYGQLKQCHIARRQILERVQVVVAQRRCFVGRIPVEVLNSCSAIKKNKIYLICGLFFLLKK